MEQSSTKAAASHKVWSLSMHQLNQALAKSAPSEAALGERTAVPFATGPLAAWPSAAALLAPAAAASSVGGEPRFMPLPLLPLSVGAGMGGGFQPREMGRPMPLPSCTVGTAAPLALARCSAAARISLNELACEAGPLPSEPLPPLRGTGPAPGDSRPAMMFGDSGAGATAARVGCEVAVALSAVRAAEVGSAKQGPCCSVYLLSPTCSHHPR